MFEQKIGYQEGFEIITCNYIKE